MCVKKAKSELFVSQVGPIILLGNKSFIVFGTVIAIRGSKKNRNFLFVKAPVVRIRK